MPWTNQGGGGGGSGGGPWGGGPSPWGRPPQGPKVEDIIKRSQDKLRGILPGGFGSKPGFIIVIVVAIVIWAFTEVSGVQPDELGVVLRFGAFNRNAFPGLNYHLPSPIETAFTPKVTRINRVDVGYRPQEQGRQVEAELLMLTGDENIVDINFFVLWNIKDATKFLFNIDSRDPEQTVKSAAESAMREVIGHTEIARALAPGRGPIEAETQKLLQQILDYYDSGIEVTDLRLDKADPPPQAIEAFRDVQTAKVDFSSLQNKAEGYRNGVVANAQGDAGRLVAEAKAYKQRVVLEAQGDAQRFISVYKAYAAAPDVTARRLYIETMEDVLKNTNKILLDRSASGSGVVPYLPLPEFRGPTRPAAPSGAATGASGSGTTARGTRP